MLLIRSAIFKCFIKTKFEPNLSNFSNFEITPNTKLKMHNFGLYRKISRFNPHLKELPVNILIKIIVINNKLLITLPSQNGGFTAKSHRATEANCLSPLPRYEFFFNLAH